MTTLAEIEHAVDALPARDTQQLLTYVAARLKLLGIGMTDGPKISPEQMDWLAEDEAAMRRFRSNA